MTHGTPRAARRGSSDLGRCCPLPATCHPAAPSRGAGRALETQLATSKRAADEDVTKFGEELQRLDSDVAGHALDEPMQQDYQRALDAYDNAKMSLDAVTKPEEIRHVTEILEDGRYAVACVKARIAGEPLPAKRPPCFFNPAHGPSSQDVELGTARRRATVRAGLPG